MRTAAVEQSWALDEGRFGLKVWFHKRWCPYGERPPWVYADEYEWLWLYAAVRPQTGEGFFLLLPGLDTTCVQVFLNEFGAQVAGHRVGLVLDGTGSHRSGDLVWPAHVVPLSLPPYSPELNPVERLFEHLRAKLSNRVFETLAELEAALTAELAVFWEEPGRLQRLTGYPWWVEPAQDMVPSAS